MGGPEGGRRRDGDVTVPPHGDGVGQRGSGAPGRCYRHPDRPAGVTCTRCGHPVCPDCMVSAAVGFQCPDCVRDANKVSRQPTTVYGARQVADPALVTKVLVALNVIMFVLEEVVGDTFVNRLELVGHATFYGGQWDGVAVGPSQWYRLLTATFLHSPTDYLHIVFNMLALWFIGPGLERLIGRWRFTAVYLISGVVGSSLAFLVAQPTEASLGASGAIFGLLGAILVAAKHGGYDPRPIVATIALNLIITFSVPNIDWRAHMGGLGAGLLLGIAMIYAPRRHRLAVQVGGCVLMVAVAAVLVWAGTVRING